MLILLLTAAFADADTLEGRWSVDLSTDPAAPYVQPMELKLAADGTVSGSFYNSPIQAGRWKKDRGRTCASFQTSDGAGPYQHAVCLDGGGAEGQSWAEHRGLLFNWVAKRPKG
jgi:hypothetical protein